MDARYISGPKSDLGQALRAYARLLEPKSVVTLADAMDAYVLSPSYVDLKPSTQDDYQYILRNLRTAFGLNRPDDLTIQDLHKYAFTRGGGGRVHREIAVLSNVYKTAIRAGSATMNPCVFWQYAPSKTRTRFPSDDELESFKGFCRRRFGDELTPLYVTLKRLIGLRLGNMLGLTRR